MPISDRNGEEDWHLGGPHGESAEDDEELLLLHARRLMDARDTSGGPEVSCAEFSTSDATKQSQVRRLPAHFPQGRFAGAGGSNSVLRRPLEAFPFKLGMYSYAGGHTTGPPVSKQESGAPGFARSASATRRDGVRCAASPLGPRYALSVDELQAVLGEVKGQAAALASRNARRSGHSRHHRRLPVGAL